MPAVERRKRARLALHWRVCLSRRTNHLVVEAETRDVSSGGFYCCTEEGFTPNERLECLLVIPLPRGTNTGERLCLRCQVEVVRVDVAPPGGRFGVACRIDDYSVAHFTGAPPENGTGH
jgi:hypothetical protein